MNEQEDINPRKQTEKHSKGLLHEYGTIVAILSDHYLKQVHAQIEGGYYEAIQIINEAAVDFYKKYEKEITNPKEDWVQICGQYDVNGYEDVILIYCGKHIINRHYSVTLKLQ